MQSTTSLSSPSALQPSTEAPSYGAVAVASVVSTVLVALMGAGMTVYTWQGLHRFGGEEWIPPAVCLTVVRQQGAWTAAVVACLYVTALLHRRPQASTKMTALAGLSVVLLYAPVCGVALGSAVALAKLWLALPVVAFFERVGAEDFGAGALMAIVLGAVPALWTVAGRKLFASERRGLAFKLFATWLVTLGFSLVASILGLL